MSAAIPDDLGARDLCGLATAVSAWGAIATPPSHGHAFPYLGAALQLALDGCLQDRLCSPAAFNSSGLILRYSSSYLAYRQQSQQ